MFTAYSTTARSIMSRVITRLFLIISFILVSIPSQAKGLDDRINEAFMPIAVWWENLVFSSLTIAGLQIPIVLIVLVAGALFFTLYFGFVNLRFFPLAIRVVRGKYDHVEQQEGGQNGEVNHFQALTTAISGTVGLGNIAMVAVAISLGGPGATFWMILAGFLGMSSKFVECTLGVKYRSISKDGTVYGGPMYYLSRGLSDNGLAKLGKGLAIAFAVLCVGASLGGGNAFQANQAAAQLMERFDIHGSAAGLVIGCIIAVLVGIVIIGGIKRIAKVTERVVPLMAGIYVLAALIILGMQFSYIDDAFALIFQEAFTPRATVTGGFIGVMIQGFRRAAFSNEAGAGSAAIAHAAVQTQYPASEGLVALLEPFIDTVVICTMTALVIIIFNMQGAFIYGDVLNDQVLLSATGERLGGVNLTSLAFDSALPGFSYILAIAVVLFALSTMLSWSYYGLQAWNYLFGRSQITSLAYKLLFLVFIVLGASVTMEAVIKFSEAMILALVFPNMIGLFFLFPQVKEALGNYLSAIRKT